MPTKTEILNRRRVRLVQVDQPFKQAVVVFLPSRSDPLIAFSPKPASIRLAEFIDDQHIVLLIGDEIVLLNTLNCEFNSMAIMKARGPTRLSRDKSRIFSVSDRGVVICNIEDNFSIQEYRLVIWSDDGKNGRLANLDEFFHMDYTRTSDARAFHSPEHKTKFEELISSGRLMSEPLHGTSKRLPTGPGFQLPIRELDDGRIQTHHRIDTVDKARKARVFDNGICRIDLSSASVERLNISAISSDDTNDVTLRSYDSSGNVSVSFYGREPLFHSGLPEAPVSRYGFKIPEVSSHKDISQDGQRRYGLAADIWDTTGEPVLIRRVIVRMATTAELRRPTQEVERLDLADRVLEHEVAARSCPEDTELRANEPMGDTELHKSIRARILAFGQTPVSAQINGFLDVFFEPSGVAFWVLFTDMAMRRVEVAGSIGPLVFLEGLSEAFQYQKYSMEFSDDGWAFLMCERVGTAVFPTKLGVGDEARRTISTDGYEFIPELNLRELSTAAAQQEFRIEVPVTSLDELGCRKALAEAASRIEWQLERLVVRSSVDSYLEFVFLTPIGQLSEEAFFRHLTENQLSVSTELKALLGQYLDRIGGGESNNPWCNGSEGIAGLGYALRALMLLDPTATDVFRKYLSKRDGEHEQYSMSVVLSEFVQLNGFRGDGAIRFGIYAILNQMWGNARPSCDLIVAVMDAARDQVNPTDLSKMILHEVAHLDFQPLWNDQTQASYIQELCTRLDPSDPYHQATIAALDRRLSGGPLSGLLRTITSLFRGGS